MKINKSQSLWQRAQSLLVGGVSSPVRAFRGVGGDPFFVSHGAGPFIYTADDERLIDYVLSWGPLILGHAHPAVVRAVQETAARGSSFGIPTEVELRLAERVVQMVPSAEKVRFVNSGTEATMTAVRLARGAFARDLVIKIEGCYHGHVDSLLVQAGSGAAALGVPTSPGIPAAIAQCTLALPFNDLDAMRAAFDAHGPDIACVILEPVPGNMGLVLPDPDYLAGVRRITRDHGALLIFDEVMSGFRVSLGGAQARYDCIPDLTALGKVIGGGLPVGAVAGPAWIMDALAPLGFVYQAGTLSGNPLAMAAGLATLSELGRPEVFARIEQAAERLITGLEESADRAGVPVSAARAGSMIGLFFNPGPVRNFDDARDSDTAAYATFFHAMLDAGVYIAPSQFETMFVSSAHDDAVIDQTLEAADKAFAAVAKTSRT